MDTDFTCEPSQFSEPSGKGLGQRIHAYFAELGGVELELSNGDGFSSGNAPAEIQHECFEPDTRSDVPA